MLTRLIMVLVPQCIHISRHYVLYLKPICVTYKRKYVIVLSAKAQTTLQWADHIIFRIFKEKSNVACVFKTLCFKDKSGRYKYVTIAKYVNSPQLQV